MQLNPIGIPLILSSIIMIAAAKRIWSLGSSRGERPFAFLLVACATYSSAYAMEISSASLGLIVFWIKAEYIGTALIPALFILFSLHFTGRANNLSKYSLAALFIIPVITLILVFTVEHHDLLYQDVYLNMEGLFPIISFNMGPWYWVHVLYIIFGILFSNLLLLQLWLNTNPVHRKPISTVLVGSIIPWLGFIFYISRLGPWYIDFMPYFISAGSIIIAWGLVRHGLFELIPIARSKLFEELPDGALIVDPKMRILDLNSAAQHYLHLTQADIGKLIKTALVRFPELVESIYSNGDKTNLEIKVDRVMESKEDKETKRPAWLKANIISIQNEGPVIDGQMIIIRDVTKRKQFEEKLYYLSTTDELTGLYNRRFFIRIAED
ncbi:MAG: histidine kinase N-terminal 7TM domain-containing protein, partial [Bacillota bacterium]